MVFARHVEAANAIHRRVAQAEAHFVGRKGRQVVIGSIKYVAYRVLIEPCEVARGRLLVVAVKGIKHEKVVTFTGSSTSRVWA